MKKKILLLLLCGIAMSTTSAWQIVAQSNTTWENAKSITVGEEITSTFTPGTVDALWYKIDITEGKWYEIPHPANYFELYFVQEGGGYLTSWYGYGYNDSYEGMRAIQFQAPQKPILYIKSVYRESVGNSYNWNIIEVTDNRVCAKAETIQLDQEINVPKTDQKKRWYKTAFETDKYYTVETSLSAGIYAACGGGMLSSSDQIFHAETAGDYYFEVSVPKETSGTLQVNEIPTPTNTTKEKAYQLELGKQIMFSHAFIGTEALYFKANLEKGKTYEVISGWNSRLIVTDKNNNEITDLKNSVFTDGSSRYFTAPESGIYYITRLSWATGYNTDKSIYWMTVDEITDPRICTYAIPIEKGQNVTYNHKTYSTQWWKIDVQAGSSYLVNFQQSNYRRTQLSLYSDCGVETPLIEAAETSFTFSATKTGTYYLEAFTDMLQHESEIDNSFQITKLINQNNTDISTAIEIEPNTSITTSHSFGKELWYKVNVEAGKVYELNGKLINDYSVRAEVYASNGTDIINTAGPQPIIYLAPDANTMYYIKWSSWNTENPPSFAWSFYEINDNRVMQRAKMITIGEEISLTPENTYPNNCYWYKINIKGGNFYEVDFSNAEYIATTWAHSGDRLTLYDTDGITSFGGYYKGKPLFAPEKDQLIYISVERRNAEPTTTLTWQVNQQNRGDNRLCKFAQEVTLGIDTETKHYTTKYNTLWYKTTLQGGKAYEISLLNANHDMFYYKENPCDIITYYNYDNRITKGERTLIYVPETSVYYFLSNTQILDVIHSDFTWKIEEVEGDNRLCNFATPITLDEEFTIDHQGAKTRWFKLDVEKDFMYSVDYSSVGHLSYEVYVYEGCDLKDYVERGLYVMDFAFTAKSSGTYYIKCVNTKTSGTVKCTVSAVKDNRSCLYPIEVATEDVISGTGIPNTGLWYKLNLEGNKIYEFDFSNVPDVNGRFYSSCGQTVPLAQGKTEKMLFKPTESSSYMLHLSLEYNSEMNWYWSYKSVTEGDNRLCEYAVKITSDTTKVNVVDGNKQFWYTYQVEKGKFYSIDSPDGLDVEIYTACGQDNPLTVVTQQRMSYFYEAESTETLYFRVTAYNVWEEGVKRWLIREVTPDGRVCTHPLNVELGKNITSTPEQTGPMSGVWYHFMPETTGWYTITTDFEMPNMEEEFPNWEDYFWAVMVYQDCEVSLEPNNPTPPVAQCAHYAGTPEVSFEAKAYTDYKIFIEIFDGNEHNWQISKAKVPTGTINVALFDTKGDIINAANACVMLYQKTEGIINRADTLIYNQQGVFESKELDYGTYLLYANNIGQGVDGKNYLPGWYENAGVWEDATEIVLNDARKWIEFRPAPEPENITQGNITISGAVFDGGESGQTGKEDVDISVYRQREQRQGAPMLTANSPRSIVSEILWELVARVKTDATGQYEINNLPAGSYMIMVDLPGYATENSGIEINAQEGQSYKNNNFETDEENKTIKKVATSLNNVEAYGIKLYPNPFDKEIVIENVKDSRLEIYNASGLRVYTQELKQEQETIQVNHLPIGVYYFRIVKDGEANSFVAIKKK